MFLHRPYIAGHGPSQIEQLKIMIWEIPITSIHQLFNRLLIFSYIFAMCFALGAGFSRRIKPKDFEGKMYACPLILIQSKFGSFPWGQVIFLLFVVLLVLKSITINNHILSFSPSLIFSSFHSMPVHFSSLKIRKNGKKKVWNVIKCKYE